MLGGSGRDGQVAAPARYRDWWIHRAALTAREVRALREGAVLAASLEVYAPLRAVELRPDAEVENRAQSTSRVLAQPTDATAAIARLEEKIARAHAERKAERAFPSPTVIELEREVLEEYAGTYEIGPGDRLVVKRNGTHLFLVDRGQEIELHALDETTFFIRTAGEPTITFVRDDGFEVVRLEMSVGPAKIPARRVD